MVFEILYRLNIQQLFSTLNKKTIQIICNVKSDYHTMEIFDKIILQNSIQNYYIS